MKAYKGFRKDMTCRDFKYEAGHEYETDQAEVCECGFHACEYPLDCLGYYEPGEGSVYHEVELGGKIDKNKNGDTKVAATKIKIGARLTIAGLVKAAIDYTMARIKPEAKADETRGASSAGHETAIAVAWGIDGKAKGVVGAHIVLADWRLDQSYNWVLHGAKMVRIDGKKYEADTWYTINNGKIVKAEG